MRRKSPRAPLVTLDNVDVDIDGRAILHGIDFRLVPGQHWGIVGRNGSGKSTLLALLAGMRWPAPGRGARVYDFGEGPERDAVTARRRVALLGHELQDRYAARGWNFRVRDVVLSGLTRSDIPKRKVDPALATRADALLARLALGHLAARRLLGLSRGEQRRVLIARALATDPALLLLDEPASGLDAAAGRALEALLDRAAAATPIVVAVHRREDLPAIVTHIAWLDGGRLRRSAKRRGTEEMRLATSRKRRDKPGKRLRGRTEARTAGGTRIRGDTRGADSARGPRPSNAGAALIVLENADVWLDGRRVLAAIDWTLRQGEHWLVTGPNGAGKSTLLRLLHAELRPARGGSIRWPGLVHTRNVWALRRQVALVSPELQSRYLYPTTVLDAVASGFHASIGRVRMPTRDQRRRVAELVAAFELEAVADRLLTSLSYGQRHRALIARTLVVEPRVLLLDEPWAGLDPTSIDVVRHEIERRMTAGMAVVCVSHVGTGGLSLDRELELEAGRIVSAGGSGARRGSSASARSPGSGSRRR